MKSLISLLTLSMLILSLPVLAKGKSKSQCRKGRHLQSCANVDGAQRKFFCSRKKNVKEAMLQKICTKSPKKRNHKKSKKTK